MLRASLNRRTFTTGTLATALASAGMYRIAGAQEVTPTSTLQGIDVPEPVALGVMVEVVEDRSRLDAVVEQIGRSPAIVMFHMHWGNTSGVFDGTLFEYLDQRDVVPLITWEAWRPFYSGGVAVSEQPEFSLRTIVAGQHDQYLDRWIRGVASFGKPVLHRFGHEMNGNWYPWGIGVNGNTAEDFVAAWRYLHDRFADAGVDNVRWVWTPGVSGVTSVEDVFPGDEYVDYVGMSGFNWGATQQTWGVGVWQTFSEVFQPMYDTLSVLSEKPVIVAETASAEAGGSKAEWILGGLLSELPDNFPRVRAVVWFNIIKENDWRIDSSPEALRAFVQAANNPYLQGTLEST